MMACDSCPFTTDDETVAACPQCKQALVYEPSAGRDRQSHGQDPGRLVATQAGTAAEPYPERPVEVQRTKEW